MTLKYDKFLSVMRETLASKGIHVEEEKVGEIVSAFSEALVKSFELSSSVQVTPIGYFEVSSLASRRHVLRGTYYPSHIKYRVKLYVDDSIQGKLCDVYDKYRLDD